MTSYLWPSEDGWPYPDVEGEEASFDEAFDEDALVLRAAPRHLFDQLEPLERQVVMSHYGLDGSSPRSMKELHGDLGLTRTAVREALAGGLAKLRLQLLVE
jgi:DNA-directed RNA polymerase sigma subunit (sigma70/sigma32)